MWCDETTDSLAMAVERRIRKANFSDEEVRVLLREVSAEHAVLSLNDTTAVTQSAKTAIWKRVAHKVSVCGVATRAAHEVREKWRALKGLVLKRQAQQAEGVDAGKPVPYEDTILGIIEGKETANFCADEEESSVTESVHAEEDGITISFTGQTSAASEGSWSGGQDSTPKTRGEKRKAYTQAFHMGKQDSLLEDYLQSAIDKNRAFMRLCEVKNKKAMLEIKLLERQLSQSQDGDQD